MKFSFIARHRGVWQTRQMCQALSVSRAGFYEWLSRPESCRARENQALLLAVRTSFEQSDRTYGSPRVWRDLRAWGHRCSENRVARLMLAAGLQARRGSMSRRGAVWDNSAMESFFSTLKIERVHRRVYNTRQEAKADLFDYVERFYNPRRRHSTLGYLSPAEYENAADSA